MVAIPINEIIIGIYLGLLAGIFPGLIAFSLGFIFKYFTNVTIPGLGVVALSGALAGVSGGLMGLLDPEIAESWIGIVAVIVILMVCLWAHSVGDKLGSETPKKLTLARLKETSLSADLVERVDSFGQLRIRVVGSVHDIEGYPPLPAELQQEIKGRSWKFPSSLPLNELEDRVRDRLLAEFDLAEAEVSIDRRGLARISAAPTAAGLSRRIPSGKRAVTIQTLLPTGMARGDEVQLDVGEKTITGTVVSARTHDAPSTPVEVESEERDVEDADEPVSPPRAPTTTGGAGQVTVAVTPSNARELLRHEFAPMRVNSRGRQREYEAVAVLRLGKNQFRKFSIGSDSSLIGQTVGAANLRTNHGIGLLALLRDDETIVAPSGSTTFDIGDELIIAGSRSNIRTFREVAT